MPPRSLQPSASAEQSHINIKGVVMNLRPLWCACVVVVRSAERSLLRERGRADKRRLAASQQHGGRTRPVVLWRLCTKAVADAHMPLAIAAGAHATRWRRPGAAEAPRCSLSTVRTHTVGGLIVRHVLDRNPRLAATQSGAHCAPKARTRRAHLAERGRRLRLRRRQWRRRTWPRSLDCVAAATGAAVGCAGAVVPAPSRRRADLVAARPARAQRASSRTLSWQTRDCNDAEELVCAAR